MATESCCRRTRDNETRSPRALVSSNSGAAGSPVPSSFPEQPARTRMTMTNAAIADPAQPRLGPLIKSPSIYVRTRTPTGVDSPGDVMGASRRRFESRITWSPPRSDTISSCSAKIHRAPNKQVCGGASTFSRCAKNWDRPCGVRLPSFPTLTKRGLKICQTRESSLCLALDNAGIIFRQQPNRYRLG